MKYDGECCVFSKSGWAEPVDADFLRLSVEDLELAAVPANSRGFCL